MKLFCFGFGQVAQSFVDHLLNFNVDLRLITTSRKNTSDIVAFDCAEIELNKAINNEKNVSL